MNQTQPDGSTPLHWAVYRVDRELVAALLRRGAKADVVNKYGASPLAEATRVANVEIAGMLLEAGANANVTNEDGQTPLMLAARTGVVPMARLLIQHGADVNRRETYRDQSALMWADAEGHAEMVELLSRHSRDLRILCLRGCVERVREVLAESPRLALEVDEGGHTALWWLPEEEHEALAVVELLLAAGVDPATADRRGETPASWARRGGMLEVAARLERAAAQP